MDDEPIDGIEALLEMVETLRTTATANEARSTLALAEARAARAEVLHLKDDLAAAQRDQQDLRSARAKLKRLERKTIWSVLSRSSLPDLSQRSS